MTLNKFIFDPYVNNTRQPIENTLFYFLVDDWISIGFDVLTSLSLIFPIELNCLPSQNVFD